jgi:hypothetical protein
LKQLNFSLDGADELTGASLTSATSVNPVNETYAYDVNGNRTGGLRVTGPGNRLLSDGTYTYVMQLT